MQRPLRRCIAGHAGRADWCARFLIRHGPRAPPRLARALELRQAMDSILETLASPFFAVVDFALAAPVVATAMASASVIIGIAAVALG